MSAEDDDIHAACKREIAQLKAIIKAQNRRMTELEEHLGLDSTNSHKPPSTDGLKNKPKRKKKRAGRRRGAQPGHEGKKRKPLPPEQVDHFVAHVPESCRGCGSSLRREGSELDPGPILHQILELPPLVVEVTEHQRHARCCLSCGEITRGDLPDSVPRLCVGPRMQAFTALLATRFRDSKRDVEAFLPLVFGERARISLGTVSNLERHSSEALEATYEEARKRVAKEKLIFSDETSWPENKKRRYLWAAVAAKIGVTVFRIARRTKKAFQDFLPFFQGTAHCDRYGSYQHLGQRRCFCWAHLKRDFKRLEGRGDDSKAVAEVGFSVHEELFDHWHRFKAGELTRRGLLKALAPLKERLKAALKNGTSCDNTDTAGFCRSLLKNFSCLWRFARIKGGEPTNNRAECSVRHAVILRKLSFGTDSLRGSRFVERMLTVIESCRRQGRDVLDFVCEAIEAKQLGRAGPSLLGELATVPLKVGGG